MQQQATMYLVIAPVNTECLSGLTCTAELLKPAPTAPSSILSTHCPTISLSHTKAGEGQRLNLVQCIDMATRRQRGISPKRMGLLASVHLCAQHDVGVTAMTCHRNVKQVYVTSIVHPVTWVSDVPFYSPFSCHSRRDNTRHRNHHRHQIPFAWRTK